MSAKASHMHRSGWDRIGGYIMRHWLAALTLAFLPSGCVAYKPGPVSITLEDGRQGRIYFTSVDAYDFSDMIAGQTPTRVIHGDLTLPPEGVDLRGAVILSHGSGGAGGLHRRYADWLAGLGYAAFLLDHFSPREVGSTARDQIRITEQGMVADVIAAQTFLATHPRLEDTQIGHIGWSKGGVTALAASVERFAGYAGAETPLAFTAAFYPFCGFDISEERLASPLLIQIGAEDDWTPAAPCATAAAALKANGQPVEIAVYPGAQHGFDSRAADTQFSSAITVRRADARCLLEVAADGRTVSKDGEHDLSSLPTRVAYLRECGERGVGYGGQSAARAASKERLRAFIEQHLP